MNLPDHLTYRIFQYYDAIEFSIVKLNQHNQIEAFNHKAGETLPLKNTDQDITDVLPLLATETLQESFFLPFYNHNNLVFDVHFFAEESAKYIVLVAVDKFHKQVQYKQQLAHDEELEKLRFKTLFEALENAQQELIAANKSKSFYISALSHEMGNPLNAIAGYNELLVNGMISTEQATAIIAKNVEKLNGIIRQALDYDNQYAQKNFSEFKPHTIIKDLFNDFKPQARQKSLCLINQVDTELTVFSSQTKWQQIFTNLISNAIKYTDTGGVTVKSLIHENQLTIDVIDTGCGMSEQFQKQLFKAWTREYKSEAQGNGIGLVISKMLSEQLSAQLNLLRSDESGSTFRLSYPISVKAIKQTILLVDDDEDCLNLFSYYLEQDGHQVFTANSIQTLKQQIQNNVFDFIITDLNLGDQRVTSEFELIDKNISKKIVMTANPTTQQRNELYKIGFDQVLAKPLQQQVFRNVISDLLKAKTQS